MKRTTLPLFVLLTGLILGVQAWAGSQVGPIGPTQSINAAMAAAGNDGTVLLMDHQAWSQNVDARAYRNLTIRAQTIITPILRTRNDLLSPVDNTPEQRCDGVLAQINGVNELGSNNFRGVKQTGPITGYQSAVLRPGPNALIEDCIVTGGSTGIRGAEHTANVTINRTAIQDCGYIGYSGGNAHGFKLTNSWILGNNRGVSQNPAGSEGVFIAQLPGKPSGSWNKWHGKSMNEAGGGKLASTNDAIIRGNVFAYNGAVQCWMDWNDQRFLIENNDLHHSFNTQNNYDANGFATECDLSGTIRKNRTWKNQYGVGVWEAANIVITDNDFQDDLHHRALDGRGHPFNNVSITGNRFYGAADIKQDGGGSRTNFVTSPNAKNVPLANWPADGGGGVDPDPNPPTEYIDGYANKWTVVNGKAVLNGTVRQETTGITEAGVFNDGDPALKQPTFYQKAAEPWRWNDTIKNWQKAAKYPPTTQPIPDPGMTTTEHEIPCDVVVGTQRITFKIWIKVTAKGERTVQPK